MIGSLSGDRKAPSEERARISLFRSRPSRKTLFSCTRVVGGRIPPRGRRCPRAKKGCVLTPRVGVLNPSPPCLWNYIKITKGLLRRSCGKPFSGSPIPVTTDNLPVLSDWWDRNLRDARSIDALGIHAGRRTVR